VTGSVDVRDVRAGPHRARYKALPVGVGGPNVIDFSLLIRMVGG
jgi:hypothetical protein